MSFGGGTDEEDDGSWVAYVCRRRQYRWLIEVDSSFIEDAFNLYGLKQIVPRFREMLTRLLGDSPVDGVIDSDVLTLYGLIHARFILTSRGMALMTAKFEAGDFGRCPRYSCAGARVLPVGVSDYLGERVRVFCPHCQDIYNTPPRRRRAARGDEDEWVSEGGDDEEELDDDEVILGGGGDPGTLDGAFFGPTFPHVLLLSKPSLMAPQSSATYVPRIYGFRVHNQRGRLPLTLGDARGPYAQLLQPASHGGGDAMGDAAAVTAAPAAAGQKRRRVDADVNVGRTAVPAAPVDVDSERVLAAGDAAATSLAAGGAAAAAAAEAASSASFSPRPVPSMGAALAPPSTGAPTTIAPFIVAIPGVPGGVPVYGVPLAPPRPPPSTRGAPLDGGGANRAWSRAPLTSTYPPGRKPDADDFYDTDDDTPVGVALDGGGGVAAAPGGGPYHITRRIA